MLDAIKYHFRHLADFSGREGRQSFWYWFLFVVLLNIAVSMIMVWPLMSASVAIEWKAMQTGDQAAADAAMLADMTGAMGTAVIVGAALGLANLALLSAAFVRRLRDSESSTSWAILAGATYVASWLLSWWQTTKLVALLRDASTLERFREVMERQSDQAWLGLIGYVPLVIVIVFGVKKSTSATGPDHA